jgi:outer membrane protein OmpA-like peptidoglycan-associated protein
VVKVDQKQDITLSVNKENFAFQAQTVSSEQLHNRTERHVEVKAMQVDSLVAGKPYTIADILYTTDSFELNKAAQVILNGFAKYLQSNSSLNIRVNGHTDDLGNEDSNLQLSQARAEEVKRYLSERGVSAERMTARITNPAMQSCGTQKMKHKKRGFDESPSVYFAAAYAVNFFFSRIRADLPVRSRK